jgi:hypothetical protein
MNNAFNILNRIEKKSKKLGAEVHKYTIKEKLVRIFKINYVAAVTDPEQITHQEKDRLSKNNRTILFLK